MCHQPAHHHQTPLIVKDRTPRLGTVNSAVLTLQLIELQGHDAVGCFHCHVGFRDDAETVQAGLAAYQM